MREYADEAYLHARVYAMKSRLLSFADYAVLAGGQGENMAAGDDGIADPVAENESLFRKQISVLFPLAESTRRYAPLFLAFFRQFEALNVKLLLARALGYKTLQQWYDIEPYAVVERSLLDRTVDVQELREILSGTYLEAALAGGNSYGQMERGVDGCAAKALLEASSVFPRFAKRDFGELAGSRLAVVSAIWSLRLKKIYHWDDDKVRLFLENYHDALGGAAKQQAKAVDEALGVYLERMRTAGGSEPSVEACEHYLEQYDYNKMMFLFHRDFHSIYCVTAYLWLLYYQIRNLMKIMEGRRFGFSAERLLGRIVCSR